MCNIGVRILDYEVRCAQCIDIDDGELIADLTRSCLWSNVWKLMKRS